MKLEHLARVSAFISPHTNNGIDASCPCDKLMKDEPSDTSLVSVLVNYSSLGCVQHWGNIGRERRERIMLQSNKGKKPLLTDP